MAPPSNRTGVVHDDAVHRDEAAAGRGAGEVLHAGGVAGGLDAGGVIRQAELDDGHGVAAVAQCIGIKQRASTPP